MSPPTRRQRLALVLLVLVSVTFVTLDYRINDGSAFGRLRGVVASLVGPAQRAVGGLVAPVGRLLGGVGDLGRSRARAARLAADNARLRAALSAAALDHSRVEQLAGLRLLAGLGGYRTVPAAVVALGPASGGEWVATLGAGSRDGVRPQMTVVDAHGLVGRVRSVGPYTSMVLLAIDPTSAVGSRLEGSGQLGLTRGAGLGALRFELLDPQAPLRVGDRLVTGPYGQTTYAAGVPIGTVVKVSASSDALVRTADVKPAVDFAALDLVGVVVGPPRHDPRDRVLPPRPARAGPSPPVRRPP